MYACFDQPDLKAIFSLHVIVPQEWLCISNGRRVHTEDAGAGKTLWRFNDTPGALDVHHGTGRRARTTRCATGTTASTSGLYCRKSLAEFLDPDEILEITKQGFDFFHRVFDYRYPFDKYDQLFVPEFNAGAMENAGCVTFLEDYIFRSQVTDARRERRAVTILHEMAHMWFGDLVTMRWWDDLWLNESFAEYASMLAQVSATRWKKAWTTFANTEKTWALRADQLPSTHPVVADAIDMEAVKTNFDGITYAKGASVLKQLVAWVGQEEFLSGLRSYFRQHEYSNTTLRDLLDALEVASGRNLGAWSREWLETTGVNTLQPRFETDSSGLFTTFDIVQEAPAEHPTLRSHRLAVGLYDRTPSGELLRRERVELDVTGAITEVPKLLGARQPDLVLVNDDDLSYAKIRLDRRSLETLLESIADFQDSLPRTLCWMAAWDMTRDAEMRARDYARSGAVRAARRDVDQRGALAARPGATGADAVRRARLRRPGIGRAGRSAGRVAAVGPGRGTGRYRAGPRQCARVRPGARGHRPRAGTRCRRTRHSRRLGDRARADGRHGSALDLADPVGRGRRGSAKPRSRPSSLATPPPPARSDGRRHWPPVRRRRPRKPRGRRSWTTTNCPTTCRSRRWPASTGTSTGT